MSNQSFYLYFVRRTERTDHEWARTYFAKASGEIARGLIEALDREFGNVPFIEPVFRGISSDGFDVIQQAHIDQRISEIPRHEEGWDCGFASHAKYFAESLIKRLQATDQAPTAKPVQRETVTLEAWGTMYGLKKAAIEKYRREDKEHFPKPFKTYSGTKRWEWLRSDAVAYMLEHKGKHPEN